MDFPAEVSTNSYALDGSSDIAYAIWVPAQAGVSNAPESVKAEQESLAVKSLERLRRAETELREARILVSLDKSRGELFTFYRKEDLQRDAKSIFNRVVIILRKNEFHMSSKNAIKPADLLQPDRARLHSQFMSAILFTIKSVFEQDEDVTGIDSSTFLCRRSSQQRSLNMLELDVTWNLLELKAQLLPNGQILTIIVQHELAVFKSLPSLCGTAGTGLEIAVPNKVLLAPSGQYARYTGGHIGKLPYQSEMGNPGDNPVDRTGEAILRTYRQQCWKLSVKRWLAEYKADLDLDAEAWIEVEVPLCEVEDEYPITLAKPNVVDKIIWKSIFWPSSLIFVNTVDELVCEGAQSSSQSLEDPLKFIEDWATAALDRQSAMKKLQQESELSNQRNQAEEMDMSHDGNIHVDAGQSFQRVTSLDGQGLTTIYPTPPDGPTSHVTPGVASIDGPATTPGDGNLAIPTDRTVGEAQMMDATGGQSTIGSGLYDEDLFDDVAGRKFGEAEMSDEPNWDFFDEPDADLMKNSENMDLDRPAIGTAGATQKQSPPCSESEHSDNEFAEVPDEHTSVLEPLEPSTIHESDAENAAADSLDQASHQSNGLLKKGPAPSSPPLSPIEVRKKIFLERTCQSLDSLHQSSGIGSHHGSLLRSHFDSNVFQPQLKVADSRYIADGLFWFDAKDGSEVSRNRPTNGQQNIPTIGLPKRKQSSGVQVIVPGSDSSPSSISAQDSDFDSSELFSEPNEHGSPEKASAVRAESLVVSPEPEYGVLDSDTKSKIQEETAQILELLYEESTEQSLSRNYQPLHRPPNLDLPVSRDILFTAAQVLVDQVSQSLFRQAEWRASFPTSKATYQDISGKLQSIYGGATDLDLQNLMETSPSKDGATEGSEIAGCSAPFIRVFRAETIVDALPSIQMFWETLALQPMSGRKSMTAICIHPAGTYVGDRSSAFLRRMSHVYSNCNLGSHHIGYIPRMTKNGLVEWEIRQGHGMRGLLDLCEKLGSSLLDLTTSTENFMVYVVNPFQERDAFADICIAFVTLFNNYAKVCGKNKGHELNLQIVPMSFIVSPDTILIPSQAEYLSLALEVYNRCPPTLSTEGIAESGAAVMLAEPAPSSIKFSLMSDTTSPLSKDREILHLAYSQSVDLRWITACWTDNLGKVGLTMTYCLRQKGTSTSRPRSDILKEMWEISADVMIGIRGKWRLFVAREGPIEPEEINEWCFLANQSTSARGASQCLLTILTFDEHSPIQFYSPIQRTKPQLPMAATAGKYGTPASTPSAAAMTSSPEQFTASTPIPFTPTASSLLTAPTPPDQTSQAQVQGFDITTDPDATLVDPADESWSVVLPFGLNNSHSSLDNRPALLSGFLLKRRGPLDSDGLLSLGVNLIHVSAEMTIAEQKGLRRELLRQWRGLYLLAKTKNLADPASLLPWHVRTVTKGCRAVASVL